MSKLLTYSYSLGLIVSLIFSSVGYTVVSFACPQMEDEQTACMDCKQTRQDKPKDCCKPQIERKVVKAEFERPSQFRAHIDQLHFATVVTADYSYVGIVVLPIIRFEPLAAAPSVEKCALLSTFLI
jgi:hypothetical protein